VQKIDPEVIPNCQHGVPAFVRTVLKDGPTKGKQYYGCGLGSEKCSFFQWVGAPNCEHELPCTRQVVKKEGRNQGRNFWCCNQIDKCKTFRWIKDGE
jgi:DNA topoisomerase-3